LLEQLPHGRELGMAYAKLAQRCMNWEDSEGAIAWGTRAIELAEQLDDTELHVYALVSVGGAQWRGGAPREGGEKIERGLDLAQRAGLDEHVGRAFVNLAWLTVRERSYGDAASHLERGLEYCDERGLDLWYLSLLGCRARLELDQGRWSEAVDSAGVILRDHRKWPVPRLFALVVLGLVRARRGDPDVWPPLDAALAWAQPTKEVQLTAPAAAARAEAAWLEGRRDDAAAAAEAGLELALRSGAPWEIGDLACWRRRAGRDDKAPSGAAEPYALEMAGEWARAAELWEQIGCPYEAALARAQADDHEPLRRALDDLQRLGAAPAAAIVARRLRQRGARGLPKGPRKATRENPAQLTARELEVLELVAQGLGNAEIAERLFLSQKTVGHHVSAILRKLDVRTRAQASAQAVRLGLAGEDQ
jgi:DNA-binding CsgD family transcriptional regulator